MTLTLRQRIVLAIVPMLLLLAAVGAAGVGLLHHLSRQIDAILRENYRSVNYMERLNEALERIDSSFGFALSSRESQARAQYDANWPTYEENLRLEQANITLAGERDLVDELTQATELYRRQGTEFFAISAGDPNRISLYHDRGGLLELFKEIKQVSGEIRRINQSQMEQTGSEARQGAKFSILLLSAGLVVTAVLAAIATWYMTRTILQPIRAVTVSAREISSGNLDQVMPVSSPDEVGELAQAFNLMARHLREYRRSKLDQLIRAQRTSQATIDSFPDPVIVVDSEGHVEMANPAARQLLGVLPAEKGRTALTTWQPPETLRQPLADALTGVRDYLPESFDRAVLFATAGRESALLPRILTIRDAEDNTLGAAVVLQDVTRLRLLDRMKSDLVATASHELKTPLTGLRMAIHLLLEESVGPMNPKQLELLLDARDNSERLLAVVNNLLDLARLEEGTAQLDVQPASPRSLLQGAADGIAAQAQDKNIEIAVSISDGLPAVAVDTKRLDHALRNLLDNALAYSDRGGRITLSAALDGDAVVLSVADTGCGIPSEHLPHLFEKFFRVPGQSRGSGTGLGLAIVREIVTAHGGSITCESRIGEGTTFRIRLPISSATLPATYVFGSAEHPSESTN